MFVKKIIQHGNSLALVIPKEVCRHYGLKRGDFCVVTVDGDNDLVIRRFDANHRPDLVAMVDNEVPTIIRD